MRTHLTGYKKVSLRCGSSSPLRVRGAVVCEGASQLYERYFFSVFLGKGKYDIAYENTKITRLGPIFMGGSFNGGWVSCQDATLQRTQ